MMDYQLKGVYLFQTATVTKLLREGWEPFWGYRCTHEDKETVRMYFRKAPEPVVTQLEAIESEPPTVQIDPKSIEPILDMFAGMLNDAVMDIVAEMKKTDISPMRAGGTLEVKKVQPEHGSENEIMNKKMSDMDKDLNEEIDRREHEEKLDNEETEIEESPIPAGDGFKIVDEVPVDLPVRAKTDKQIAIIEQLRNTSEFNITVFPVDDEGNVKIFKSDDIVTVKPDGSVSKERNPANRDSTAV